MNHFSEWFSPQTIRRVATKLRTRHGVDHPFAMNNRFRTDGKSIFMEATEDESALQTLNLMNDHFVMSPVIEQSLFEQIFYVDDLARRWRPYAATPLVLIDPKVAFGKPIIDGYWVPTDVLSRAYHVEGGLGEAA